LLGDLLRRHGYIVVTADDGESGLVETAAQAFGLAMVDIGLPGVSGVEVATQIKRQWPKTTVVLMTGYTDQIGRTEASEKGIDAVLTKPFALDQITSLAERALASGAGSAFKKPQQARQSLAAADDATGESEN
jgi:DNA-binding response OmpR family regulator